MENEKQKYIVTLKLSAFIDVPVTANDDINYDDLKDLAKEKITKYDNDYFDISLDNIIVANVVKEVNNNGAIKYSHHPDENIIINNYGNEIGNHDGAEEEHIVNRLIEVPAEGQNRPMFFVN